MSLISQHFLKVMLPGSLLTVSVNILVSSSFSMSISARNHMIGRAILDKLPECIFKKFEIAQVKRGKFQNFQKS